MATTDELREWLDAATEQLRRESGDRGWEEWRSRFLELLGVARPEDHPLTDDLVRALDEVPETERDDLLESDRFRLLCRELVERHAEPAPHPAAAPSAADTTGADDTAFITFLTVNAPRWDGTAESWKLFHDWLAYEADLQGVGPPVIALLARLDGMTPDDRIGMLARYTTPDPFGWVTGGAAVAVEKRWGRDWTTPLDADLTARWGPDWNGHPAAHKAAWLAQLVDQGAFSGPAEDAGEVPPGLPAALAATFAENPQALTGLSDAEIEALARRTAEALLAGQNAHVPR